MPKELTNKFKISMRNTHLNNIFQSDSYLELGNIDYQVLSRLLSYEIVNLEDIAYNDIQSIGLGKSSIESKKLKNKIPYLFFENINHKNKGMKLMITCGLVSYFNDKKEECFAPIVLIPVNIYFEDENIFFQETGKPEINPNLPSLFTSLKLPVITTDKLDSYAAIDKYCLQINNVTSLKVTLENYLTYVLINEKEIKLDHDKFEVTSRTESYLYDKYFDKDHIDCYYSLELNKEQRVALLNALMGNNFTIVGRLGTGKTTTLFNIAMNLIISGKKVLYISNMKETLETIKSETEKRGIGHIVADFSSTFHNLFINQEGAQAKNIEKNEEELEELFKLYQYVNEYEKEISRRILNYRFVEVLEELAIISDLPKKTLAIDDLSEFYKHECEEIINSLTIIEKEYKRFCGFDESVWKAIPIYNTIRQPGQIIALISQIHQCFTSLLNEQKYLEENYGLKKIDNYAMLKNVAHDLNGINENDIPKTWMEETNNVYEKAKSSYKNLKNEIYHLQEVEYYLNYKYNDLSNIDIDVEIQKILGPYFKEEEVENVNRIIIEREQLLVKLNRGAIHREVFYKTLDRVRNTLNWDFPEENKYLEIIIKLTDFLNDEEYNKKILTLFTYGRIANHLERIKSYKNKIDEYSSLQEECKKMFGDNDLDKLPIYIALLKGYLDDQKLIKKQEPHFASIIRKHKYTLEDINSLIIRASEMVEEISSIRQARNNYMKITGERYTSTANVTMIIEKIDSFLNQFTREERKIILDYMMKISEDSISKTKESLGKIKNLNLITKSYREINEVYNKVRKYICQKQEVEITEISQRILEYFEYIKDVCASNAKMYELLKDHSSNDVLLDKYIGLRNELKDLDDTKYALENNEEYRFLYQNLYKGSLTNINTIARVIQNYEIYSSCFKTLPRVIESFEEENHNDIMEHLDIVKDASDNINEIFKLYCKIFKDGVSRYYYNEIGDTIEYLRMLLNSKEELTVYLNITKQIRVLDSYHLEKLEKYIVENKKIDNLVIDFKYTYFTTIKDIYLKEYPFLSDIKTFNNSLKLIVEAEKKIFASNEEYYMNQIKKISSKGLLLGVNNLGYKKYVERSINHKYLYLSTTEILNNYLSVDDFDVILVDDAHLLNSNAYHVAVEGKQVIVAGEYQLQSAVSNNLMSRMRHSSAISFKYRYSPISKTLLNNLIGLNGVIPSKYNENNNVEIINEEVLHYLLKRMLKDESKTANIFIADFHKQKLAMEQIARILLQASLNDKAIEAILRKRINISDLKEGYLWNADYNVLFLEDYYDLDIEYITANMIDNLLLTKKRLIIFDRYDYINSDIESNFLNKIRMISKKENVIFKNKYKDKIETLLIQTLKEKGVDVLPSHDDINIVIKKKGKLYGVLILFSASGLNVETINKYRDYYQNFEKNGWKIIIVSVLDLSSSIEAVADNIIKEID